MACCAKSAGMGELGALGDLRIGIWPSDVDDFVRALDIDFQTTNASVAACASLAPGSRAAWGQFIAGWQKFRDEGTGWFGAGGRWDAAHDYQKQLANWQALLESAQCTLSAPLVEPPTDSNVIPWIAAAVVAGAAVYLFGPAIRQVATRLAK